MLSQNVSWFTEPIFSLFLFLPVIAPSWVAKLVYLQKKEFPPCRSALTPSYCFLTDRRVNRRSIRSALKFILTVWILHFEPNTFLSVCVKERTRVPLVSFVRIQSEDKEEWKGCVVPFVLPCRKSSAGQEQNMQRRKHIKVLQRRG